MELVVVWRLLINFSRSTKLHLTARRNANRILSNLLMMDDAPTEVLECIENASNILDRLTVYTLTPDDGELMVGQGYAVPPKNYT